MEYDILNCDFLVIKLNQSLFIHTSIKSIFKSLLNGIRRVLEFLICKKYRDIFETPLTN